jgi:hypothetical protein
VKRPLISLTSADIGTDPGPVEEKLLYWFGLAKAWGAILLLDEADVFLERRSTTDLVRNNLVAIFLRTLEYYQGILFLTTNRVGTFDEAFLSRIDVPVNFPPLSPENRVSLWSSFIKKLEKERQNEIRVEMDVKYYIKLDQDLLSLQWNGREIRSGESDILRFIPSLTVLFPSLSPFPHILSLISFLPIILHPHSSSPHALHPLPHPALTPSRLPNSCRPSRNRSSRVRNGRRRRNKRPHRQSRRNVPRLQALHQRNTPSESGRPGSQLGASRRSIRLA